MPTPAGKNVLDGDNSSKDVDWSTVVDRCAIILDHFGKAMLIKEAGGVAGVRSVKGMTVSSLLPHLNIREDSHHARRFVRVVEQNEARIASSGSCGIQVVVASEDAMTVGDAVVYIRRVNPVTVTPVQKRTFSKEMLFRKRELPLDQRRLSHSSPSKHANCAARSGGEPTVHNPKCVNDEFAKLLPNWRAQLKEDISHNRVQVKEDIGCNKRVVMKAKDGSLGRAEQLARWRMVSSK